MRHRASGCYLRVREARSAGEGAGRRGGAAAGGGAGGRELSLVPSSHGGEVAELQAASALKYLGFFKYGRK